MALPPAIILYGSQTGTAESIARRVHAEAVDAGHTATISPMNDFKKVGQQHVLRFFLNDLEAVLASPPLDTSAAARRTTCRRSRYSSSSALPLGMVKHPTMG